MFVVNTSRYQIGLWSTYFSSIICEVSAIVILGGGGGGWGGEEELCGLNERCDNSNPLP